MATGVSTRPSSAPACCNTCTATAFDTSTATLSTMRRRASVSQRSLERASREMRRWAHASFQRQPPASSSASLRGVAHPVSVNCCATQARPALHQIFWLALAHRGALPQLGVFIRGLVMGSGVAQLQLLHKGWVVRARSWGYDPVSDDTAPWKCNISGSTCRRGDTITVVEYSEMPEADAVSTGINGRLNYNWANICMHFFSVEWLAAAVEHLESNPKCVGRHAFFCFVCEGVVSKAGGVCCQMHSQSHVRCVSA